jgi:hypothetical protein
MSTPQWPDAVRKRPKYAHSPYAHSPATQVKAVPPLHRAEVIKLRRCFRLPYGARRRSGASQDAMRRKNQSGSTLAGLKNLTGAAIVGTMAAN